MTRMRDLNAAVSSHHDLIIIGGGVYGACALLEAAKRGVRAVLVERDDFGGATSWNSLRIVHGGLRYLQQLNLPRCMASIQERRWFLDVFPDLVKPLPCLMPLYRRGLKRPAVLRAAMLVNDALATTWRPRMRSRRALPRGRMLSMLQTLSVAPHTHLHDLCGGAVWYDAVMTSSQRVVIEVLRWACSLGGNALNHVEAIQLNVQQGSARSVTVRNRLTGDEFDLEAPRVLNCAGPWSGVLGATWDRKCTHLFQPSLAYNLLLDREPICDAALAVSPRRRGGQMYFLYPFCGRILAGTAHLPWTGQLAHPRPTPEQVEQTLSDLSDAIPGFALSSDDVLRVFCGLLPARRRGSDKLNTRPVLHNHARSGGPRGVMSVSGVKFTTARRVAERAMHRMFPGKRKLHGDATRPPAQREINLLEPDDLFTAAPDRVAAAIRRIAREEAVMTVEDLLLRRTDWMVDPRNSSAVVQRLQQVVQLEDLLPPATKTLNTAEQRA